VTRHWLFALNTAMTLFVAGAVLAPVLAAAGWSGPAQAIYAIYHLTCHQWGFRSFFLFGAQPIYSQHELVTLGRDPFSFIGDATLGWKMAFCERDLAIYLALLAVGIYFARHRDMRPLGFVAYGLLILPMVIDGLTQLFGWRESTWELRVATGLLFGVASAWLVYPRFDLAMGLETASTRYAPENTCAVLSPRG
jgi:uncharacterized membrane protein